MVGLKILVLVTKNKRREFIQAFEFLTCKSSDCLSQYLYEDINKDNRFLWMERWTNSDALEAHLKSNHFRSVLGAIEVLGELENLQLVEFRAPPDNLK